MLLARRRLAIASARLFGGRSVGTTSRAAQGGWYHLPLMTPPYFPIALIAQLADALDKRGVSYCHWKSNSAIARSETGENDLDLLIERSHAAAFREVLSHAGFSRVGILPRGRVFLTTGLPGVLVDGSAVGRLTAT